MINSAPGSKSSRILELGSCAMDDKRGVSGSTSTTELCDLPDSLLHHILSFLPTKFAFKTSVLSKRWQHVSESMPCLRFNERDYQNFLCDAVDSALLLRDMSCSVQEFSLKCSLANGNYRINRWITAAVKRNVKVLRLFFAVGNLPYQLPHCLFMSKTLVELELYMDVPLIIPTSTHLSNLKILTLQLVDFVDEESTEKLLSCPTLEELSIYCCGWNDITLLKVYAPSLLKLSISDWSVFLPTKRSNSSHTCQVLIHGAQIRSLTCCSGFINKYCITSSPLLLEADVTLHFDIKCESETDDESETDEESETEALIVHTTAANNISMLLNGLSSVQSLALNRPIIEHIFSRDELLNAFPTFSKVTMLSLHCPYDPSTNSTRYTWAIFERFPHLETLEYSALCFDDTPPYPDPVPICFRSHLKKIVISDIEKTKANISHMVQLLGISLCLEELVIRYNEHFSRLKPKELMKRLTELPKASAKCRIRLTGFPKASAKCRILVVFPYSKNGFSV